MTFVDADMKQIFLVTIHIYITQFRLQRYLVCSVSSICHAVSCHVFQFPTVNVSTWGVQPEAHGDVHCTVNIAQ